MIGKKILHCKIIEKLGSTGELKQLTHYNKANITMDYPSFSFDGSKALYSLFNKIGDIFILENF